MGRNTLQAKRLGSRVQTVKPRIASTPETQAVLQMLEKTTQHVFLTGRAGTGKSTLLQRFRDMTQKRLAVLAPTGVAAVNIQGQTIHTFFGFGPGTTPGTARRRVMNQQHLYRNLQVIVIDEMSMVRADLLDCIDQFLRVNGPRPGVPFGGVQMLFIGDLYQLPPVVPPEEETLFTTYYASPYFFDAKVLHTTPYEVVHLTKVYRQQSATFIQLLEAIRTGTADQEQLAALNARYRGDLTDLDPQKYVTLVTMNAMAERVNRHHLGQIRQELHTFRGTLTGKFQPSQLPTEEVLALKAGARIMMLTNEPRGKWVHGTLGQVVTIKGQEESAAIRVALENGYEGRVRPYTWETIRFACNERTQQIAPEVVGSFTQYPFRLAWAMTMHQAQGQTFDHLAIDFGHGTFTPGQAYVACSRCRSLRGLVLRTPIRAEDMLVDPRVQAFFA